MDKLFLPLLIFFLFKSAAFAQVNITLPLLERQVGSPDEFISVTVDNIKAEDNVMAFSFFLYYDKNVICLDSVKLGTISANSLGVFNADTANGVIKVAYVRIQPYSGSGSLADIRVKYRNAGISKLTFVDGNGKNTFDFMDGFPQVITNEGTITVTQTVSVEKNSVSPAEFKLEQNYPNPFNPATTISFSLQQPGFTTLKIYNMNGEETAVLINAELTAVRHEVVWNASGAASGVYYARLQSGSSIATKKILLLK
jgi:hypothetical protein